MPGFSRIAILSDVHGNTWALAAALEDISLRHVDAIINLGDSLYGPLDPSGSATLLMQAATINIRGNQDRLVCDAFSGGGANPRLHQVVEQLSLDQKDWLNSHPASDTLDGLFLCHGTPRSDQTYLLEAVTSQGVQLASSTAIQNHLEGITAGVILCGHSHTPRTVQLPDGRLVINPGSVGLPAYFDDEPIPHVMETGGAHARYAILDRTAAVPVVEHIVLVYPWKQAAKAAIQGGRPDWAAWLETGRAKVDEDLSKSSIFGR